MDYETGKDSGEGNYIQMFIYRVPKNNNDAFADVQGKLSERYKKHGIMKSEFFRLTPAKPFGGLEDFGKLLPKEEDEEVWLELERYVDAENKDEVLSRIGKDPAAGPLFNEIVRLAGPKAVFQGDMRPIEV
jgi:uncharacterized protein YbaA (DUF1428 family)